MKTFQIALGIASCIAAQEFDPVSRAEADLAMVIMINAPGLSSPKRILNLAKNPSEEAQWQNRITPMGQRQ